MIRYALICDNGHQFEAWFRDSAAFDAQVAAQKITCATCGSDAVTKALMAPAVATRESGQPSQTTTQTLAADPSAKALVEAVKRLRRHVIENAEYVGNRFAVEARKIHYEEAEHRDIYGEATLQEAQALNEEGIEVHPLPPIPDEQN